MITTSSLPAASSASAAAAVEAAEVTAGGKSRAAKSKASRTAAPEKATGSVAEAALRAIVRGGGLSGLVRALGTVRTTIPRRTTAAGYSTVTSPKTTSLAFLRDPKLSIEEKLLRLLGYLNAKWDKELQEKLDKIGEGTAAATSTSKPKKKSILASVAGAFSSALGGAGGVFQALKVPAVKTALKKLGGPVLAAAASALGVPAAAPVLLKHGSTVVDAALGLASAAAPASAKTSAATSSSSGKMNDSERQTVMMEIQHIRSKQQEMFGLVSNILKSTHDTRTGIIHNIR